eukprot:TRINITY_DN66101_c0_g1_i1.p1 TRINITY_DN66101_c0_g1~~TRINITY_DN66101_c0_g1_i1.p1  ORF type:complete len:495 (-),score=103.10 TRINITY_DN66101_c0_g1_i1:89-1573(-)
MFRRSLQPLPKVRPSSTTPRPMAEIPGPRSWPLMGTLPDFMQRNRENPDVSAIHKSYYDEYGDIYRLSMPPFGDHVVVCDPRAYLKVFQIESSYPSGGSGYAWPFMEYHESQGNATVKKLFMDGEPWREYRQVIAKDLFGPAAAREYLPAIAEAARLASVTAECYEDRFDEFASRLAFDMFCALALGRQPQTTNEKFADPADRKFVENSMQGFTMAGQLMREPHRRYLPGRPVAKFFGHIREAQQRGLTLANELCEQLDTGGAKGHQKSSYMAKLFRRGQLSKDELSETLMSMLMAGVDTTSNLMAWLLLNLAQNPEKQQRLRVELIEVLQGADLDEKFLKKLPYLKACIRESHRHTPSGPFGSIKKIAKSAEFCGYEVLRGTTVVLNQVAYQKDAELVPDSQEFKPERWMPEEVDKRKEDKSAVLDHLLLSSPFSFGARMCLGSRVAQLEIQAATCRLVQDYKLELLPGQSWTVQQGMFAKADPFPKFKLTRL